MTLIPTALAFAVLLGASVSTPAATATAQNAEARSAPPRLAANARSASGFAPAGWAVEQQASGDISGDGVADLAFVLRKTDLGGIIRRDGYPPEDTNPRILAVAIGGPDGYRLSGQDAMLIPTRDADGLNMDDPFTDGALEIDRGVLSVGVMLFMNAGGADAGEYTFRYRYRDGAVWLIGYDHDNVQRMSGETTDLSANLLTGRVTVTTGSIETDATQVIERRTTLRALPMDQVGDAFMFETERLQPIPR